MKSTKWLLLAGMVVVLMTFVAQRTRYGRYVFAYGGNPEAALLSGLPTTWRPPAALVVLVAEGPVPAGRPGCVRGRPHRGETLRAGLIERG